MKYRTSSNYDKSPRIPVGKKEDIILGWKSILSTLLNATNAHQTLVIDCYHGVYVHQIQAALEKFIPSAHIILSDSALKSEQEILDLVEKDVTSDRIFGFMTRLHLEDFFDIDKIQTIKNDIRIQQGKKIILGLGAQLLADNSDLIVYADMPRWEIQQRQRKNEVNNIGVHNKELEPLRTYKHSFFVDWRVLDRYKKATWMHWDFVLDTKNNEQPKMISAKNMFLALKHIVKRPFRLVPFFDPGVWGGQWMKEVCNLDPSPSNYAWCFDGVPEENSIYLSFDDEYIELPSINVVFAYPCELLGDPVHARFGDEFPIRFDFLDTMGGQNLSYQVHPLTEYIQEHFGMHYTQDESYYILDAEDNAEVYLGLKENANLDDMFVDLEKSKETGIFPDEKYAERFAAKKHDHFLIPAGTIHCSGKNAMVLEISATPYIFTFKLWDWGRLGMDGKPRPINIAHGKKNVVQTRRTAWVKENLVNVFEPVAKGDGWREERTGLHEREFIETRRHWFSKKVLHNTGGITGSVNMLNLVEGEEIIVESPTDSFAPFIVHYAETFIIPAAVGQYTIRPHGISIGTQCATMKAFVRHKAT